MNQLHVEITEHENNEVETYLTQAIVSYGVQQLQGESPYDVFFCYRDSASSIIAAARVSISRNLLFISHLYVEEKYRRQGIGKALLLVIEESAKKRACNVIRLNTLNEKSHAFYLRAGFMETVRISSYMNGFDLVYYHKTFDE